MRILAFILDPGAVRKILAHLGARGGESGRAPLPARRRGDAVHSRHPRPPQRARSSPESGSTRQETVPLAWSVRPLFSGPTSCRAAPGVGQLFCRTDLGAGDEAQSEFRPIAEELLALEGRLRRV
jgi:hypothetical protein